MKGKIRKVLTVVLALVFAASAFQLVRHELDTRRARAEYEEAARLAGLTGDKQPQSEASTEAPTQAPTQAPTRAPEQPAGPPPQEATQPAPTEAPTEAPVQPATQPATKAPAQPLQFDGDLSGLQAVNSDVQGWILIPDTILSYPLLQTTDNDYYLKRTWKKQYSAMGSIYLDYRCDAAMGDDHTIIYGHRMRADDMFGSLRYYKKLSYWKAHPDVYITTAGGEACYRIFAAYETDIDTGHVYRLNIGDMQAYIDQCLEASVIDTGVVPQPGEPIVTLSTCVAQGSASRSRWVVQAVLQTQD